MATIDGEGSVNVGELIARLKEFDPELPVVLDGYESGLEDVTKIEVIDVAMSVNLDSFVYGPHERVFTDAWDYADEWGEATVKKAVYLPRQS